jgi:L-threonylcarbamoyladenylate synthase
VAEHASRIDLRANPDADLTAVADHMRAGGLVAYPTETVYGFGSVASSAGVEALQALKRRETGKPFIVLIDSAAAAADLRWTEDAQELAGIFWPGAVTLVLGDPKGVFPSGLQGGGDSVAVRVSPQPVVRRLIEAVGEPITSTSANVTGGPPARSGTAVMNVLEELGRPDVLLLDAGTLPESGPSTIIDCTTATPTVLREGTVPLSRLRCAVPEIHEQDK